MRVQARARVLARPSAYCVRLRARSTRVRRHVFRVKPSADLYNVKHRLGVDVPPIPAHDSTRRNKQAATQHTVTQAPYPHIGLSLVDMSTAPGYSCVNGGNTDASSPGSAPWAGGYL